MAGDQCSPELVREHENRITAVEQSAKSAHLRMSNLEKFTDSMAVMAEKMSEMNGNVMLIAEQIKQVYTTLVRHEDDIKAIHESMETKDTVKSLHGKVEELEHMVQSDKEHDREEIISRMQRTERIVIGALITMVTTVGAGTVLWLITR